VNGKVIWSAKRDKIDVLKFTLMIRWSMSTFRWLMPTFRWSMSTFRRWSMSTFRWSIDVDLSVINVDLSVIDQCRWFGDLCRRFCEWCWCSKTVLGKIWPETGSTVTWQFLAGHVLLNWDRVVPEEIKTGHVSY